MVVVYDSDVSATVLWWTLIVVFFIYDMFFAFSIGISSSTITRQDHTIQGIRKPSPMCICNGVVSQQRMRQITSNESSSAKCASIGSLLINLTIGYVTLLFMIWLQSMEKMHLGPFFENTSYLVGATKLTLEPSQLVTLPLQYTRSVLVHGACFCIPNIVII